MKYGWFSPTQLSIIKNNIKRPYIYYYDYNNKIVQITEIKLTKEKSEFKDANYVGPVKKYYASYRDSRNFTNKLYNKKF